jgi:hypothetical protein
MKEIFVYDSCGALRRNEEHFKSISVKFEGKLKVIFVCVDGKIILQQIIDIEM